MGTDKVNVRGIIECSSRKTSVSDLQKRGIQRVRLIDEKQIHDLIGQAVERIIAGHAHLLSAKERARIVKRSRAELSRLVQEREAEKAEIVRLRGDLAQAADTKIKSDALLAAQMRKLEELRGESSARRAEAEALCGESVARRAEMDALRDEVTSLKAQLAEARAGRDGELLRRLEALESRLQGGAGTDELRGLRDALTGIGKKIETIRTKVSPDDVTYRPGKVTLGEIINEKVESNIDSVGVKKQSGLSVDDAMKKLRGLRARSA